MPQDRNIDAAWFTLSGPDCAPLDRGFANQAPDERKRYWFELARLMFEERRSELFRRLGVDGQPLKPRKRNRRDRATGPVLIPHFSDSRFSTKMRYEATADLARVYWTADWAIVVQGHASGRATGIVRDVCGLTVGGIRRVVAKAREWWQGQRKNIPWHQQGDISADFPVPAGAVQVTPRYRAGLTPLPTDTPGFQRPTPWGQYQDFNTVFQAAGEAQTNERQIARTIAEMGHVETPILREMAERAGVVPAGGDRADLLETLRRTLADRQREAERLIDRMPGPPQPPRPPMPPAPPMPAMANVFTFAQARAAIVPTEADIDAPLPVGFAADLPPWLGAHNLRDVLTDPDGLAWWLDRGRALWNFWKAAG